jgi:hypothetical protein
MKIELWDIDRVQPYELNAKKHDNKQVEGIVNSIQRFGWDQPIVVDGDGKVIKGHGRRLAAIKLGLKKVPVLVRTDLTPEQANAARIADNRVAIGDLDTELLKLGLESLNLDDLAGIFDEKELTFLDSDMTEMNTEMFIEDLDSAVAVQTEEIKEQFEKVVAKRISIVKALGFKDIPGSDQIFISRFMAEIETMTEKKGDEAFLAFIKQLLEGKS